MCRHAVDAYYSNYGGNPAMTFQPGMVGTIMAVAPKVVIYRDGTPVYDNLPDFLVVDFFDETTQKIQRCGLNYCNAELVPLEKPSEGAGS
jgi:hypothetical protein